MKTNVIQHALSFGYGGMSESELSLLYDISENKSVLELGSMVGMSSYVIASVAKDLDCIDVWSDTQEHLIHDPKQTEVYKQYVPNLPNMFNTFCDNCKEFIDSGKLVWFRGNTNNLYRVFNDRVYDLLIIDADHSYYGVSNDFKNYYPKVKKGGLIAFHDYGDSMWIDIAKLANEKVNENLIRPVSKIERLAVFEVL